MNQAQAETPAVQLDPADVKTKVVSARAVVKDGFWRCGVKWEEGGSEHPMSENEIERLRDERKLADVRIVGELEDAELARLRKKAEAIAAENKRKEDEIAEAVKPGSTKKAGARRK